jgi:hypothetical protein
MWMPLQRSAPRIKAAYMSFSTGRSPWKKFGMILVRRAGHGAFARLPARIASGTCGPHEDMPIDGCVTVLNVGSSLARVSVAFGSGPSVLLELNPGETGGGCRAGMLLLELECVDVGRTCTVQWRLDVL